ncbi:hypothetical protein [Microseira sp. BLCC-F43]|jgi:hypothetical protein|uniref:hypothetical protein n=1 Tax=Microseira sp. BLCC-F43 TaxID=3153602 RepID=UPI0035BA1732
MNDFEHLQSVYRQIHNQQVNEFFRNVDLPENIDDIRNIPAKASLKKACLIKDNDSASMMDMRVQLFNLIKGDRHSIMANYDRIVSKRKHKPQITIYFYEKREDVDEGYEPITGEISFRVMNAGLDDDISESQARTFGQKIKLIFGGNEGLVWRKGKDLLSYCDWDKGYQLQILCRDKSEGRRIVEKILQIQDHVPEWERANYKANEAPSTRYPTLPPTKTIFGRAKRMPRERPIADVYFRYAAILIRGMTQPVVIYEQGRDQVEDFIAS